jgi:hypothetical protein
MNNEAKTLMTGDEDDVVVVKPAVATEGFIEITPEMAYYQKMQQIEEAEKAHVSTKFDLIDKAIREQEAMDPKEFIALTGGVSPDSVILDAAPIQEQLEKERQARLKQEVVTRSDSDWTADYSEDEYTEEMTPAQTEYVETPTTNTESIEEVLETPPSFETTSVGAGVAEEDFEVSPLYEDDETVEESPGVNDEDSIMDIFREENIVKLTESETVFSKRIRKPEAVISVSEKKLRMISDDVEFEKELARAKRRYSTSVKLPLPNSGVEIELIGVGAFDFERIYAIPPESTEYTHELERMKTIIRSIVGSTPKIPPSKIADSISYMDHQMMTYGLVAATVKDIRYPHICVESKCLKNMTVEANVGELLLNAQAIEDAHNSNMLQYPDPKDIPFRKDYRIDLKNGDMVIHMRLPSYLRTRKSLIEINGAIKNDQIPKESIELLSIIIFIEKIEFNGFVVDSPLKILKVINLLAKDEYKKILEVFTEMNKGLINPVFGIPTFKCPACGTDQNISIDAIEELVFFHLLALTQSEQMKRNSALKSGSQK